MYISAHTLFMCFVFISEGTATSAVYRRIGFATEIKAFSAAYEQGIWLKQFTIRL
jgi:hypothetical protein